MRGWLRNFLAVPNARTLDPLLGDVRQEIIRGYRLGAIWFGRYIDVVVGR